jgi:hypothetical protein
MSWYEIDRICKCELVFAQTGSLFNLVVTGSTFRMNDLFGMTLYSEKEVIFVRDSSR